MKIPVIAFTFARCSFLQSSFDNLRFFDGDFLRIILVAFAMDLPISCVFGDDRMCVLPFLCFIFPLVLGIDFDRFVDVLSLSLLLDFIHEDGSRDFFDFLRLDFLFLGFLGIMIDSDPSKENVRALTCVAMFGKEVLCEKNL